MNKKLLVLLGFLSLTFIAGCGIESTNNAPIVNSPVSVVFDIPSLVDKNVDDIISSFWPDFTKNISEPTNQQLKLWVDEWDNSIDKEGYTLLITYNPKTRKVVDLFLSADKDINNNRATLIQVWNLINNANNYFIEDVQALKNPSQITGIKIIKKD